jgi:putative membrane protein
LRALFRLAVSVKMRAILHASQRSQRMTLYLWIKTFHLLFVIAWMAAVFYLPRILVNVAETAGQFDVQARLVLMGRRLYRFGHSMFGLAVLLGAVLWLGYRFIPDFPTMVAPGSGWLHAKLALVVAILAYFIFTGRWLKGVEQGKPLPSSRKLRLFNELPVLALVAIIWLVLFKPF